MTRPLRRSGTTSSDCDPGTVSMYCGSAWTSFTSSGWPEATAAPTEALTHLDAQRSGHVFRIADGARDQELVAGRVEQIHGKRVEFRQPGDELRNLLEQLLEVEHRRHFAAEREESGQLFKAIRVCGH